MSTTTFWDSLFNPVPRTKWRTAALLAILALGFFLRLWKLGSLTDGMLYDEGYKGLDALAIRLFGDRPVFLDWNGGREALVAYSVAAMQKIFGQSIVSVRIVSALAGCASLWFLYAFASTIFNRNVGLVSTAFLAVSKYHIIHSRLGVRAGQFGLFEIATLYLIAKAYSSSGKRAWWLAGAGAVAGLGFNTYIAYRIFPVIVLAFFIGKERLLFLRQHWKEALVGLVLCCAIAGPLAKFYFDHYESMTDRVKRTAVWNQKGKNRDESPAKLVWIATRDTLEMFHWKGDGIERHNIAGEPMLSSVAGPFLIVGFVLALLYLRKPYALFLILYLLLTLLPGFLSVDSPNTARVQGCLPPVSILCAIGLLFAQSLVSRFSPQLAFAVAAAVLGANAAIGIRDTMVRYPERIDALPPETAEIWGMDRDPANVALLMNRLGPRFEIFATPQFYLHAATEYLTYSKTPHNLIIPSTDLKRKTPRGKIAIVFFQPATMNLWFLRDDDGKRFYKWWSQAEGMTTPWIRAAVRSTYGSHPQMMKGSDDALMQKVTEQYPSGKILDYGGFSAYITKP